MRVDSEYLKEMLERVLDHDCADFNIDLFSDLWRNVDDHKVEKFVFHMELLADQCLIDDPKGTGDIGIVRTYDADKYTVAIKDLRLTAQGHSFASALNKPGVFKILKEKFVDEGPIECVKATIALSSKMAENKLNSLLNDTSVGE